MAVRINKTVDYMIRCVLRLAQEAPDTVLSRKQIVEEMEIPDSFFRKIVPQLARAGIVDISRGPNGGYRLIVAPEDLTVLHIVEAESGRIFLNDCVLQPSICSRSANCTVHPVWERMRDQFREILSSVTFAELVATSAKKS